MFSDRNHQESIYSGTEQTHFKAVLNGLLQLGNRGSTVQLPVAHSLKINRNGRPMQTMKEQKKKESPDNEKELTNKR